MESAVDTHAHVHFDRLAGDLPAVLQRATPLVGARQPSQTDRAEAFPK